MVQICKRVTETPVFINRQATIYLNTTLATQSQIRLKDKGNVNWSVSEGLSGRPVMMFQGVPVRKMDTNIL